MRKRIFSLAVAASLVVAACGSDDSGNEATPADPPTNTGTEPETEASGDTNTTEPQGSADETRVFRMGMTAQPDSLDPIGVGADAHTAFLVPVYETLTRSSDAGDIVPGLAESWSLSDDGLTFTMELLEGVVFHDGTPFDAEAVVANLDRARSEESLLSPFLEHIDAVVATGPHSVELQLNRSGGDLPGILRTYAGMMVSPTAFDNADLSSNPVGTGPFTVTDFSESGLTYAPWEDYRDSDDIHIAGLEIGAMRDDTARFNAVRSGQLDAAIGRPDQLQQAEEVGLDLVYSDRVLPYGIFLNTAASEFDKPEVRKAFMHAIDRESINQFLFDGKCTPLAQLYTPTFWAHNPDIDFDEYAGHNPEKARELLASVGLEDGFSMELTTSSISAYQRMAEAIQAQVAEVGIDLTINVSEVNLIVAGLRNGEFDAAVRPLYPANPDPTAFINEHFMPDGTGNTGGMEVPGVADALERARASVEPDVQGPAIHEISELVLEAGTRVVPICQPDFALIVQDGWTDVPSAALGNFDFTRVSYTD